MKKRIPELKLHLLHAGIGVDVYPSSRIPLPEIKDGLLDLSELEEYKDITINITDDEPPPPESSHGVSTGVAADRFHIRECSSGRRKRSAIITGDHCLSVRKRTSALFMSNFRYKSYCFSTVNVTRAELRQVDNGMESLRLH